MNTARSVYDPGRTGSPCWWRPATRPVSFLLGGVLLLAVVAVAAVAAGPGPAGWVDDLTPITAADWDYDKAAHLIERAGFGATPEEIERLAAMTPEAAVNELVDFTAIDNAATRAFDPSPIWDPGMDPFPKSRADAVRIARETGSSMGVAMLPEGESRRLQPVVNKFFYGLRSNAIETQRLATWFGERMLTTRRPLEEKLTLFWHGHFATGNGKVRDTRMMFRQNEMLRANAAGSFRDLLVGILTDPAMLVYLDNGENRKGHPNENFGRELLELFTIGVGNYSEQDIREASRAFTGWTNDVLEFRFDAETHDDGEKTFLARTGAFNGEDIIDIILDTPVTAEYIGAKLYRFFVREEIDDVTRTALGATFRDGGYELRPLLRRIFLSRDFYSQASYASQIKSPVQLVVSTYRKLGLTTLPTIPDFNRLTAGLGQTLFNPPNVAGWAGGRTWITPALLLERGNLFRGVLLPDTDGFWAPDRSLPGLYAQVGRRIEAGMNITAATQEGDAESSLLADRDEDYNTRYGGYMGYVMAYDRLTLVPRQTAELDLARLLEEAGATTVEAIVDHLVRRFLRVPVDAAARDVLVAHLRDELGDDRIASPTPQVERALRSLLYLVLSAPEYQLA
ncbi:MAG: hypothetical protein CL477_06735 [Acidobacteria bacterium]|nr:hypothetical protein [Acidobacteriota bacterium]HJN46790.1 DUF1800 domain-containing protein [Vicinamibacterales bacterium]